MKKAVCVISGGLDSAVAAFIAKQEGFEIIALHFNYHQRTQAKELESFHAIAKALDATAVHVIDLDFFKHITASALIDTTIEVPIEGVKPGVPVTYVPFRNGIFISIATALAEKEHAQAIVMGVVQEDSSGYPDCTQEFMHSIEKAINEGTKEETRLTIMRPLVSLSKADIVKKAYALDVPIDKTYSCYKNQEKACGVCDSCRLRLNGFKQAGYRDPIEYEAYASAQ